MEREDHMTRRRPRETPFRRFIPNLVTIFGLCVGLLSVRAGLEGRYATALYLIIVAVFLDAADGKVARFLKAESEFGAELDTLSDFFNFGIAPTFLIYNVIFAGTDYARSGWFCVLVLTVCCALRLARFNVALTDSEPTEKKRDYFVGVPAPALARRPLARQGPARLRGPERGKTPGGRHGGLYRGAQRPPGRGQRRPQPAPETALRSGTQPRRTHRQGTVRQLRPSPALRLMSPPSGGIDRPSVLCPKVPSEVPRVSEVVPEDVLQGVPTRGVDVVRTRQDDVAVRMDLLDLNLHEQMRRWRIGMILYASMTSQEPCLELQRAF